jgi:HPt (histidine-containing phosphotransfer) domain-containing protein
MTTVLDGYYSALCHDADLGELVDLFVAEVPDRLAQLQSALENRNWPELARFAHQWKGAGGSYGFPQLTPVAAHLEMLAKQAADETSLRLALDDLISVATKLRAGLPK